MEISVSVSRAKREAEQAARETYRRLLTKQRPDDDVSEEDVQATIDAMGVLNITTEQAEADAAAYKEVVLVQADRDCAATEVAKLGPEGDASFRQQLDDLDIKLAEAVDKLLRPKRRLLAQIARFDAAAETLAGKESLLMKKRSAVPRLTG